MRACVRVSELNARACVLNLYTACVYSGRWGSENNILIHGTKFRALGWGSSGEFGSKGNRVNQTGSPTRAQLSRKTGERLNKRRRRTVG